MNAEQARLATKKALSDKERKAQQDAARRAEERRKEDEYSRKVGYPSLMKSVRAQIAAAARAGCKHDAIDTSDKIVADLVVERLLADGYGAHIKSVHVPEDGEYGSSGEGMHGAYTSHSIHVNWGKKGECPSCDEDFDRRRRGW